MDHLSTEKGFFLKSGNLIGKKDSVIQMCEVLQAYPWAYHIGIQCPGPATIAPLDL